MQILPLPTNKGNMYKRVIIELKSGEIIFCESVNHTGKVAFYGSEQRLPERLGINGIVVICDGVYRAYFWNDVRSVITED